LIDEYQLQNVAKQMYYSHYVVKAVFQFVMFNCSLSKKVKDILSIKCLL